MGSFRIPEYFKFAIVHSNAINLDTAIITTISLEDELIGEI